MYMAVLQILVVALQLLALIVALFVAVPCYFRGLYYLGKALRFENKTVTKGHALTSCLRFTNALIIPNGIIKDGRVYRNKGFANLAVFALVVVCAVFIGNIEIM